MPEREVFATESNEQEWLVSYLREAMKMAEKLVPESRLLAAEARVREVEAERDALKEELDNGGAGQVSVVWVGGDEWHDEWCAWYKPEEWPLGSHRAASAFIAQKVATLRAERDALAHHILRYGWHEAECPFIHDTLPCHCGFEAIETQARAILAREVGK